MTGDTHIGVLLSSNNDEPTTAKVCSADGERNHPLHVNGRFKSSWNQVLGAAFHRCLHSKEPIMNRIIYIVGLVVIVIAILSFFGLR